MVDPKTLKKLRKMKGWSQAELQSRSKVDKQTISRLERGTRQRTHAHTVKCLSEALGVAPAVLAGEAPIEIGMEHRSTVSVRMDEATRNALTLTSIRYDLPPDAIVELAPFLFTWAAEMSLRQRAERLKEVELQLESARSLQDNLPHLSHMLTFSSEAFNVASAERDSIEKRDLFADSIQDDGLCPVLADDFEEAEGPFVRFLQKLAAQIEPAAEFGNWHRRGGPDYQVCPDEAAKLVGGDGELAQAILSGAVPLHKMPPEFRKRDAAEARIAWVRQAADEARERADAFFLEMGFDLGTLEKHGIDPIGAHKAIAGERK